MITKEMISNGLKNGLISIEDSWGGCLGICCKIGDMSFYFAGSEGTDLSLDEYKRTYTNEETVDMIYDILKSPEEAELSGLDDWEIGYYESILNREIPEAEEDLSR